MSCSGTCNLNIDTLTGTDFPNIPESEFANYVKLNSYDWLRDIPYSVDNDVIVEVSFKNTRKEFYINSNGINLKRGNIVVVASDKGHDVGFVTLTGKLAEKQYKLKVPLKKRVPLDKIHRLATENDLQTWKKARSKDSEILTQCRIMARELNLEMKIGEVEIRGDNKKITVFYIADYRVDFRELLKMYRSKLNLMIEMRQIGARQEAGLVGGIGSCGRELCCSSWRTSFDSVSALSAEIMDLPPNMQRLVGKCGKLKCCLMYELDQYIESRNDFPDVLIALETQRGIARKVRTDILSKIVWYSYDGESAGALIPVSTERIKEIILMNKKGEKPEDLVDVKTKDITSDSNEIFVTGSADFRKKKNKRRFRNNNNINSQNNKPKLNGDKQ